MDDRLKNDAAEALINFFDSIIESKLEDRLKSLNDYVDSEIMELKKEIAEKHRGDDATSDDADAGGAKREAYNEAYIAIQSEAVAKEADAFNRGVAYGKSIIMNKLDSIEKQLLKKYSEYENGTISLTDLLNELLEQ